MAALANEIVNLRRAILAISVDAPIALLETEKRPGQIKVDQPMALKMQVQAFRCHIDASKIRIGLSAGRNLQAGVAFFRLPRRCRRRSVRSFHRKDQDPLSNALRAKRRFMFFRKILPDDRDGRVPTSQCFLVASETLGTC